MRRSAVFRIVVKNSSVSRAGTSASKLLVILQNAIDIGFREIIAHKKQAAGMSFRHLIGEAIAEIEGGRIPALSPSLISLRDAPCGGGRDAHDFKTKPADDARHFRADISSRRDDKGFGHTDFIGIATACK